MILAILFGVRCFGRSFDSFLALSFLVLFAPVQVEEVIIIHGLVRSRSSQQTRNRKSRTLQPEFGRFSFPFSSYLLRKELQVWRIGLGHVDCFLFVPFFSFLSITPSLADRFVSSGFFEQGRRFFISFGESATQMSSMENSQLRRWFVVLGEGGRGVSLGWASRHVDVKSFPVRSPFTSSWFVSSGLFSGGRGFLLPFGERATQMSSMENSQLRRRYVFLGVFLWAGYFDTLM